MSTKETKTNKTILRVLLAGVVLLLFCGAAVGAVGATDLIKYNGKTFTDTNIIGGTVDTVASPFTSTNTESYSEGILKLKSGQVVNLEYTLEILVLVDGDENPQFTINLNGGVIQRDSSASGNFSLITINSGKGLAVTNGNSEKTHQFTVQSDGRWKLTDGATVTKKLEDITKASDISSGMVIEVTGGCITGGTGTEQLDMYQNTYYRGGGVYVAGGTFTMDGGNIVGNTAVGNTADSGGGGVWANGGTFTMSGGNIAGNTAKKGGGVWNPYCTFTMSDGSIVGNPADEGGGVYAEGGFTLSGGSIVGNSATSNGGGVQSPDGTFTMSGGSIAGNTAPKGGGVYKDYDNFIMTGGSIAGNNASENGGGVFVTSSGTFTMENSDTTPATSGTITNNTVTSIGGGTAPGGGVYVAEDGTFTLNSGTISYNKAINSKNDSNQFGESQGGGVYTAGTFNMNGGTIEYNEATMMHGEGDARWGNSECNGGGVFVAGGEFTMKGGSISNNTVESNASGGGGGVCVDGGTFTMQNSDGDLPTHGTISNNIVNVVFSTTAYSVKVHGGGGVKVYMGSATPFAMSGDAVITGNSVTTRTGIERAIVTQGGGVYVYNQGSAIITIAMSGSAKITGNSAEKGGGVYVGQKSTLKVSGAPVISGNTKTNGTTANNVYLDDYFTPQPLITVSGALTGGEIKLAHPLSGKFGQADAGYTITNEDLKRFGTDSTPIFPAKILPSETPGNGLYFGGVAKIVDKCYSSVASAVADVTGTDETTITMIANSSEPTIEVSGNKNIILDLNGKVLANDGTTKTVDGVSYKSVIYISSGGNLKVIDNDKTNNHYFEYKKNSTVWGYYGSGEPALDDTHKYEDGWKIFIFPSLEAFDRAEADAALADNKTLVYVKVAGGCITGGTGTGSGNTHGGGVYVAEGGSFTLNSGNIIGNSATQDAGGVYVGGTFNIEGGSIAGNFAPYGGGVRINSSNKSTMNGGLIVGNTTTGEGGGVEIGHNAEPAGVVKFELKGGEIKGNKANTGGGVWIGYKDSLMISGGSIAGNTATLYGGGVYVNDSGTFTMSGSASIKNNSVTGNGGGVAVSGGTFTMNGGTIGGTGVNDGNTATKLGGGVYVESGGVFTLTNGDITGNAADENGGGVYFAEKTFNVSGTPKISGNTKGTGESAPANNVYLRKYGGVQTYLTLTGPLDDGAEIHITSPVAVDKFGTVSFTEGSPAQTDADHFSADIADGLDVVAAELVKKSDNTYQLNWVAAKTITVTQTANGRISTLPVGAAIPGNKVAIHAIPFEGYKLKAGFPKVTGVSDVSPVEGKPNVYKFTMPEADVEVTAAFEIPSSGSGSSQGSSTWISTIPTTPADNTVATDVTTQYAGQKFIPVSAANLEQITAADPAAAAAVEAVLQTASAHGIPLTNSKGAKAIVNTTESVAGLQTETFAQIIDVTSADGSKVTSVPFKVRLSDLAAKSLTTDDVTLYHYLEEYGIWVPLETRLVSTDSTYAYYEAATDGASPFGVLLKKLDAPGVQPVPTQAGKTPVPFAGVLAGLGAAAVVFGLRRK